MLLRNTKSERILMSFRYVSQFSRSLYVEYGSRGIDVQWQVNF